MISKPLIHQREKGWIAQQAREEEKNKILDGKERPDDRQSPPVSSRKKKECRKGGGRVIAAINLQKRKVQ